MSQELDQTVEHHSARSRRAKPKPKIQLQLTSMIDVIFQLLIYFVVTASFAVDEGVLTARLPEGTGTVTQQLETNPVKLEVILRTSGPAGVQIEIRGLGSRDTQNFAQLRQLLKSLRHSPQNTSGTFASDSPVIIEPQGEVRWQHVVNAFNAAMAAGYENIRFKQANE